MKKQINIFVPKYTADRLEGIAQANGVHVCSLLRELVSSIDAEKKFPKLRLDLSDGSHYVAVTMLPEMYSNAKKVAKKNNTSIANIIKYEMIEKGLIRKQDVKG